jgi:hypothetical protein
MELTEGSETSANHNLTPGKYPKEYIQYSKHGESLKSRTVKGTLLAERSIFAGLPPPWEGFFWNFISYSFRKCATEMQLWLPSVSN